MKQTYYNLTFGICCLIMAFLLTFAGSGRRESQEALAARISPGILRLHVLADSDSAADQKRKLEVRNLLIDTLHTWMSRAADLTGQESSLKQSLKGSFQQKTVSKQDVQDFLLAHTQELEQEAEHYLQSQGCTDKVRLELGASYFPDRYYAVDAQTLLCFPCGTYDALRVVIGSGRGHNWWCVLYPSLCFTDITSGKSPGTPAGCVPTGSTPPSVPASSADLLRRTIKQDDYLRMETRRPAMKLRLLELFHPKRD